jgi:hypothetical protein
MLSWRILFYGNDGEKPFCSTDGKECECTWTLDAVTDVKISHNSSQRKIEIRLVDEVSDSTELIHEFSLGKMEKPKLPLGLTRLLVHGSRPDPDQDLADVRYGRLHRLAWYRSCERSDNSACETFSWRVLGDALANPLDLKEDELDEGFRLSEHHRPMPLADFSSAERVFAERRPLDAKLEDIVESLQTDTSVFVDRAIDDQAEYLATLQFRRDRTLDRYRLEIRSIVQNRGDSALPRLLFREEIIGHRIGGIAFDSKGQEIFLRLGRRGGNAQVEPLAIVSVDHRGRAGTFSPELLGWHDGRLGPFTFVDLCQEPLERMLDHQDFARVAAEIDRGVSACRAECAYFACCRGGAPANKLAEHGRLDGTETLFCRLTEKRIADRVLRALERVLGGDEVRLPLALLARRDPLAASIPAPPDCRNPPEKAVLRER